jgi:hypothetical protein
LEIFIEMASTKYYFQKNKNIQHSRSKPATGLRYVARVVKNKSTNLGEFARKDYIVKTVPQQERRLTPKTNSMFCSVSFHAPYFENE